MTSCKSQVLHLKFSKYVNHEIMEKLYDLNNFKNGRVNEIFIISRVILILKDKNLSFFKS